MQAKKFKELIAKEDFQKIVYMHCNLKINLTSRQLDKVLKLKNKEKGKLWKNKSMNI